MAFPALFNVLGEVLHGDKSLRQWRLRMETSIFPNAGPGVAVILVSSDAIIWVGGGVRSLPVSGEVEGAR